MNIFTRFLSGGRPDRAFDEWIERWDVVEALVVRVYKGKGATAEDEAAYGRVRPWLLANYGQWEEVLRPHWQVARAAQEPAKMDPFVRLLRAERAADFVGDWEAMQYLPAAREAINRLLLSKDS